MNKSLKEAIAETLVQIDESDEFKRKLEAYIRNHFEGGAGKDDLRNLIDLVGVAANAEEEL